MSRFFQYLFDGLSSGAIYSLLALCLVVVYRGTGYLNFAQGEMSMFCTFLVWKLNDWGMPLWLAAICGMLIGYLGGATVETTLIRPVAKRSQFAVFVVAIGLFQLKNSQTTKAVFTVLSDNHQMTKLTHKRIAPHLTSIRYSWGTFKLLNS